MRLEDLVEAQTKKIVRLVVEAQDPKLDEVWYHALISALFERVRADWQRKEVLERKRAQAGAENERSPRRDSSK